MPSHANRDIYGSSAEKARPPHLLPFPLQPISPRLPDVSWKPSLALFCSGFWSNIDVPTERMESMVIAWPGLAVAERFVLDRNLPSAPASQVSYGHAAES